MTVRTQIERTSGAGPSLICAGAHIFLFVFSGNAVQVGGAYVAGSAARADVCIWVAGKIAG